MFFIRRFFLNAIRYTCGGFRFKYWGANILVRPGPNYRSLTQLFYSGDDLSSVYDSNDGIEFFAKHLKKNDVFFDVGANVGLWSLLLSSRCDAHAIAVEPSSESFPILLSQLRINPRLNIQPVRACLTNRSGSVQVTLGLNSSNFISDVSSIHPTLSFSDYQTEECRAFMLDDLASVFGCPRGIKIDVEGAALEVIEGSVKTLKNKTLEFLYIEFNRAMIDSDPRAKKLNSILLENGFFPSKYNVERSVVEPLTGPATNEPDTLYVRMN